MSESSRSSAIYKRLLALYPSEIRRRHKAEMLQNFDDLERESSSTAALWLVVGRDLVTSIGSYWSRRLFGGPRSFARQTRIIVAVLALLMVIAWIRHPEHLDIALTFCVGYAVGWTGAWWRRRTVVVLDLLAFAYAASTHQRFLLTVCYGCTLGFLAGWRGSVRAAASQGRPPRL